LKSRFPRNEFQIGHTEILLSRGIWPGLGLRLQDVVFKQDVCGKLSFILNVPQAVLPVDLLSLRHGRIRLGRIEVTDGRMHLDYHECPPKTMDPLDAAEMKMPSQGIRSAVAQKGIKPPRLDWEQVGQNLEALELNNFTVTYERNMTWKAIFRRAEASFSSEMNLLANLDVEKSLPFGTLNHSLELSAIGDGRSLQWAINAEFKEGRTTFKGNWDLAENTAMVRAQLTQIPLKDVSSELYQMGFVSQEVKLRTAWMTCSASWEGQVAKLSEMPVRLKACKVEGAYGRVDLEQADLFPSEKEAFKVPAQFKVQKLQVQPLVEAFDRQILPTVLARLGVWSGTVSYASPARWQIDGFLENAELIFSNQSVRGKQLVRSVHTLAQRTGSALELSLAAVQLQDGDFAGSVEMRLGEDGRTGAFNLNIEKLSFSPSIQALLIGGQMTPLKLTGSGRLESGELVSFSGQAGVPELKGDGWRVENLAVTTKYAPGVFHLEAKAQRAEADARWRLFSQLQNMRADPLDAMAWKDLGLRLDVLGKGGTIQSFSATELGRNLAWRGKGSWVRDGGLTGSLAVGSGAHTQMFALRGEKNSLSILDRNSSENSSP
jgi:hypothetical protein